MRPDRNPDGFDGHRRRYIAGVLGDAASAMPPKMRRDFRRYLTSQALGQEEAVLSWRPAPKPRRKPKPVQQPRLI